MAANSPAPIRFNSDALKLRLEMEIPADTGRIAAVVESAMEVVRSMRCAEGQELEVGLALQEAMANAVVHGAGSDAGKRVSCRVFSEDEHGVVIVVTDPGDGFDLASAPDPHRAENLNKDYGRGIYLINRLMTNMEFVRGGAEIRMRKVFDPT